MRDADIVMESPTDSPEQIEEGLAHGQTSAEPGAPETIDVAADLDAAETDTADEPIAEPVGEVTPRVARGEANRDQAPRRSRPQTKAASGAARGARREAEARATVLDAENKALRTRLEELATGRPAPQAPSAAAASPTPIVVPDTHPAIAPILAQIEALGAKPKQEDFDDFEKFQDAKDGWIEERAILRGQANQVRQQAASYEATAYVQADQRAQQTRTSFEATVGTARSRHSDYEAVMDAARKTGHTLGPDVGIALMESPVGGEVVYHLAKHTKELERINGLSPHRQLVEIGQIEARLIAHLKAAAPSTATPPRARVTAAPDPQRSLVGDLPSSVQAVDLNDPSLTQAQYNRARDEMDVQSGRRVRMH